MTTYSVAGRYGGQQVINGSGTPVRNSAVLVFLTGTTTKVDLFSDRAKTDSVPNPVLTDGSGNLEFYCDPGLYDLVDPKGNIVTVAVQPDPASTLTTDSGATGVGSISEWDSDTTYPAHSLVTQNDGLYQAIDEVTPNPSFDATKWTHLADVSNSIMSVFGRTGPVVAEAGDYTAAQVGALAPGGTPGGALSATASRASTYSSPVLRDIINVLDYGAVGDGTTDDTEAVQAAIDALPTGGSLYIPSGFNFYCASALTISNFMNFHGDGYGSVISTSVSGTFISLTGKSRIKFVGIRFLLTSASTTGTLFSLNDCFRVSWHRCFMFGQFTGPAGGGSYLGTTAVNFNNNTGNCYLIETEIDNFGIGVSTSAIQNWIIGGQIGTNNVGVYGSGDGGMSIDGVVFVSNATSPPSTTHIDIDGAVGEWWITNTWFEGCGTGVIVGNDSNGPVQFGMSHCKVAATTTCIDLEKATSCTLANVLLSGDDAGVATPTPIIVNTTGCVNGFVLGLYTNMTAQVSPGTFPKNWAVFVRGGGGSGTFKAPTNFQMTRSDGTAVNVIQLGPSNTVFGTGVTNAQGAFKFQDTGASTLFQIDSDTSNGAEVNALAPAPSAAGFPVPLRARGTDTNIGIQIVPKGTGVVGLGLGQVAILSASNATWPIPPGASLLEVTVVGAGSGGGGSAGSSPTQIGASGGAGAPGQVVSAIMPVGGATTLAVVVGNGGAGGTAGTINQGAAGQNGTNGGVSSVTNATTSQAVSANPGSIGRGGALATSTGGNGGVGSQGAAGTNASGAGAGFPLSGGTGGASNAAGNAGGGATGLGGSGGSGGGGANAGTANGTGGAAGALGGAGPAGGAGGGGGTQAGADAPDNSGAGGGGAGGTKTVASTGAVGAAGGKGGSGYVIVRVVG